MVTRADGKDAAGFTLVELIAVMVIVSIVVVIGSRFVVIAIDTYAVAEKRSNLIAHGRATLEQITRQLRNAVPNAVRVSTSGNCLEFLPIVGGGSYLDPVPDAENNAPPISSITTSPVVLNLGAVKHALIGALLPTDVYTAAIPSARVDVASASSMAVNFASPHRFIRNSINQRFYLADDPNRFCLVSGSIVQYQNYGLPLAAISDVNPGGVSLLLAEQVYRSGPVFVLSPGSEERNTGVDIQLGFSERGERVLLQAKVLVRNVP